MKAKELNTLLGDLYEELNAVNEKIGQYIENDEDYSRGIMEDVWHSINNRIEDVERRIEDQRRRKVRSQTEKLMSENID